MVCSVLYDIGWNFVGFVIMILKSEELNDTSLEKWKIVFSIGSVIHHLNNEPNGNLKHAWVRSNTI